MMMTAMKITKRTKKMMMTLMKMMKMMTLKMTKMGLIGPLQVSKGVGMVLVSNFSCNLRSDHD